MPTQSPVNVSDVPCVYVLYLVQMVYDWENILCACVYKHHLRICLFVCFILCYSRAFEEKLSNEEKRFSRRRKISAELRNR
jgi:hypothetical protein